MQLTHQSARSINLAIPGFLTMGTAKGAQVSTARLTLTSTLRGALPLRVRVERSVGFHTLASQHGSELLDFKGSEGTRQQRYNVPKDRCTVPAVVAEI